MDNESTAARYTLATPARPPKGLRANLERMLAGARDLPEGSSLPTAQGAMSKAGVVSELEDAVAKFEAVDAQLVALKQARLEVLVSVDSLLELYTERKAALSIVLGRKSPMLLQFGLKPHQQRRALTAEESVVRAEKARQTRILRHTMGSRQKAALKFDGQIDVKTRLRPTLSAPFGQPGLAEPEEPAIPGARILPAGSG
jgi:hypothetical protein